MYIKKRIKYENAIINYWHSDMDDFDTKIACHYEAMPTVVHYFKNNELIKTEGEETNYIHLGRFIEARYTDMYDRLHNIDGPALIKKPKERATNAILFEYRQNGLLHRDDDLPARIWKNGKKEYYKYGVLHRDDDKPAVEHENKLYEYYINGYLHREGAPARIKINKEGEEYWSEWRQKGKRHRSNGPSLVIKIRGIIFEERYEMKGKLHRKDGPAFTKRYPDGSLWIEQWCVNGELHRIGGPANIQNGYEEWYQFGKLHRNDDKPALTNENGEYWYQFGKLHRDDDKPAKIIQDGSKYWYQFGKLHRDDDKPAVNELKPNGSEMLLWYNYDKLHRLDKPAKINIINGEVHSKSWYKNGVKHRLDGPCELIKNRPNWTCWCIDGISYTFETFITNSNLSEEDKLYLKLKFG